LIHFEVAAIFCRFLGLAAKALPHHADLPATQVNFDLVLEGTST